MAKKLPVALNDKTEQMLEEIKAQSGSPSLNAAVNFAIFETHRSLFPSYLANKGKAAGRSKEERAADRRDAEEAEQMRICEALGGKIEGEGAARVCVYFTYNLRKRYEQRMSLGLLNEDLVSSQYQPSKEKVEKLKAEGKTDW